MACAPRQEVDPVESEPDASSHDAAVPYGPIAGELGTAHPTTIQAVSPSGHWLAICQARSDTDGDGEIEVRIGEHGEVRGDDMHSYLVRTAGTGEPIDAFVNSDPSGRHVAIVKRGGLVALLDTWNGGELELPRADSSDDPNPFGPHRAVAFDAGGHAAWAERVEGRSRIVVHDLEDGSERRIEIGSRLLWRFELDPTGEWLWVWTIDNDTDANGKVEIPKNETTLSDRLCRGHVGVFGNYGRYGDQPVHRVAPVVEGAIASPATGVLGVLGGELIVRLPDASIVRRDQDGEHVLVPAECDARVVHADEPSRSLWVACHGQKRTQLNYELAPLHRFGFTEHEDVHLEVDVEARDVWNAGGPYLYTASHKFVNVTTGTVGRPLDKWTHLFWEDSVVYDSRKPSIASMLADMPEIDETSARALARATTGELLVAARNEGFGTAIQGPLRWIAAPLTERD